MFGSKLNISMFILATKNMGQFNSMIPIISIAVEH